ncbi:MAG: M23 family metallopeptidase [Flavobacteriales bacterium]|jgi:murein DD-endopeptidase MepM/ murein hydrolase activator NlpD|nr:M23 family metallopeptidase [Flavobacteriales bacterium]
MGIKYKYNTQTLSYEKVEKTTKDRLVRVLSLVVSGIFFAGITWFVSQNYLASPKEREQKRELSQLKLQYNLLNKRVIEMQKVMEDVQYRDDNIYRVIFEAEPIPSNFRKSGRGGVNRYRNLEGYDNSKLVIETTKRLDQLEKRIYVQSKSFDDVYNMAMQKELMLASIPAVQPVANKDLKRMASGYGKRIHPVYKTEMMHWGMDFSATIGTEIYATGNGVVKIVKYQKGYGKHVVINHGYGYETYYAHMSKFNVRVGQKIKRGEVIGYIGNTGTSTAPHLHYEVHKNGKKLNPVNYYFNDLSPEEYDKMLELSAATNQSFD